MDTNKKLETLEHINHATEVLEENVNTLTEKILVDAFNELSVEDQMLVLLGGMLCETQPEFLDELAEQIHQEEDLINELNSLFFPDSKLDFDSHIN